jgi:hypothetical protein
MVRAGEGNRAVKCVFAPLPCDCPRGDFYGRAFEDFCLQCLAAPARLPQDPSGACFSSACSRLSTCFHRSEFIARPARQFAIEQGSGGAPVAHRGHGRYFERLGRLFHGEPAKKTHFHDLPSRTCSTSPRVSGCGAAHVLTGMRRID